jgi:hypothetical protein
MSFSETIPGGSGLSSLVFTRLQETALDAGEQIWTCMYLATNQGVGSSNLSGRTKQT